MELMSVLSLVFSIGLFFLCLHKERTKENARCRNCSACAAMPTHSARLIIIWEVITIVRLSCYEQILQALKDFFRSKISSRVV